MASAAPEVCYPNVYGIDMPSAHELIAHDRSVDEICELIGADGLMYQDLGDLIEASKGVNETIEGFDCAVFNGEYITGDVTPEYLAGLEQARNDAAKKKKGNIVVDVADDNEDDAGGSDDATVGIHNEIS